MTRLQSTRGKRADVAHPTVTGISLYNRAARASSATVIDEYSTSFGLATRLLGRNVRTDVRTVYALVRIADEIVDGAATGAGVDVTGQHNLLDDLERETERGIHRGFSTNLIVHAFALTARECGIDEDLTRPFFASMRRDLDPRPLSSSEISEYIYGSAEVVGLMCLRVFVHRACPRGPEAAGMFSDLAEGARRLGAAFQKINFLRDLAADNETLGRNYFPDVEPGSMTEGQKHLILDDIDADLDAAAEALPRLPNDCRRAVEAAQLLFTRLSRQLRSIPASELLRTRVRVTNMRKLGIVASVALKSAALKSVPGSGAATL